MRGDQKQDSTIGITVYYMRGKMVLDNILGRNYYSDYPHYLFWFFFVTGNHAKIFNSIMKSLSD